jgi:hypothetical protein
MGKLAEYRKTIAAVLIGALTWATMIVESAPSEITSSEWIAGGGILLAAIGVYAWANEPKPA